MYLNHSIHLIFYMYLRVLLFDINACIYTFYDFGTYARFGTQYPKASHSLPSQQS